MVGYLVIYRYHHASGGTFWVPSDRPPGKTPSSPHPRSCAAAERR